ncbi:MAG: phytanoyl-CoA dioxygenase family protein [Candidatus Latescibacteria bacterium]|nr:phytanoyl-CoA dioxygenase family protein [Candidatus Latescibacterota bacterium]
MDDLEMQQFLFDVNGYLIVENALNTEEVAALNQLIDDQELPPPGKGRRFGSAPDGPGYLQWGKPFCDLLDHSSIMPILRFRLGDCFRLDRIYGMYMSEGMSRGRLHAYYGAMSPISGAVQKEYFPFKPLELTQGFVVITWNLTDAGPDHGGFCCIPGSHKSNFRVPRKLYDASHDSPHVIIPEAPAGSAVIFSEALTHGTADWYAKHERRSLLYKYCVSQTAWRPNRVQPPTSVELTPRQQILLREPAEPLRHFPSLFEGFENEDS